MSDESKATYYRQSDVVDDYDRLRFGRGGGPTVARIENRIVEEMLLLVGAREGQTAIDAPCGTGRFIPILGRHFSWVLASDLSAAMLKQARPKGAHGYVQAELSALPLRANAVHFFLMSRFLFHFEDPLRFLSEAARVLVPGGHLLFDAYNWTPRQWIPGEQRFLGGRTYLHPRTKVAEFARAVGLEIVAATPAFLVPPYLYGFLPARLVERVESWSKVFPSLFQVKTYYLLRKLSRLGNRERAGSRPAPAR